MGSVEGRVAIQYVNAQNPKDNFTFKCHRSNGVTNGFQDIYAVNDIAFHPAHGTLATVGSDGRFSFWDKVSKHIQNQTTVSIYTCTEILLELLTLYKAYNF